MGLYDVLWDKDNEMKNQLAASRKEEPPSTISFAQGEYRGDLSTLQ